LELKLLVIRTPDPPQLAHFYTQLGLTFDYHQHGNGSFHFSAIVNETVFEIYPLTKNQTTPDSTLRLGFQINDFDKVLSQLNEFNIKIISLLTPTAWGIVAVVQDPDGRKIELYKKEE